MDENSKEISVEELGKRVNKRMDIIADNTQERLEKLESKYWDIKSSNENQFWVSVWTIVATVIVLLVLMIFLHNISEDYRITEMVESGIDPISAHCAFAGERESGMCTAIALTMKNSDLRNSK